MTQEEKYKIISNEFADLIILYNGNIASLDKYDDYSVQMMNAGQAIIYLPITQLTNRSVYEFGYSAIPTCYALCSVQSLEASGVDKLRRIPVFNLRGNDVLVGIIDTGIDYTNPVFQYEDGTSKIVSIWDQSIDSVNRYPQNMIYTPYYGTVYSADQINQALKSDDPLQIVPSTDEIGHGTMLAGIAAGSEDKNNNFSGVVPDSELIVVKLKQAKTNLKEFLSIPLTVPCYMENDIIWALEYIFDSARQLERPVAICIGLGSSQGSHGGRGALNSVLSIVSDFPGVAVSIAAGNEGNARRHFYSTIDKEIGYTTVELNVGENEPGFIMELWGNAPNIYTIDILSPSGEYIPRLSAVFKENRVVSFLLEKTVINIDYILVESYTGNQIILLRFKNPSQGIWRFQVYARGDLMGSFHIWLPSDAFISENTYFLQPDAYTTITSPGNSLVPITVTAYNSNVGNLYQDAGRGYTSVNNVKPDFAAPGVNIQCPALDHSFTSISGTGAATAHTVGITAMILEWSIVKGNYTGIDTVGIKKFLIRGAQRRENLQYPNQDWGYGILDIYNVFDILRAEVQRK